MAGTCRPHHAAPALQGADINEHPLGPSAVTGIRATSIGRLYQPDRTCRDHVERMPFARLENWRIRYMIVYAVWAWTVVLAFPPGFDFA